MKKTYWAHVKLASEAEADQSVRKIEAEMIGQTVEEHLRGTAALSSQFAEAFGEEKLGELIGLVHDLGRCTEGIQNRLLRGGPKVDHATAGAVVCATYKQFGAAACVAGHHGGLPDFGNYKVDQLGTSTLYGRLKKGIANNKFVIYLQPKFYTKTEELAGAEALVRWNRDGDVVMPNIFVPLLEKYELITELDTYVLESICKLQQNWEKKGYKIFPISVNESRLHLYNKNHINDLIDFVNKYSIKPNTIELEMTETSVVNNVELAKEAERNVHKLGFTVSMDDFGTGYSSFSMLKNINIDVLKMDKSFFDDIVESSRGKIIIEAIIEMSHKLGIEVVAEGIENKEQVDYLKRINCDMIQGYYFEKPISIEKFEEKYKNVFK